MNLKTILLLTFLAFNLNADTQTIEDERKLNLQKFSFLTNEYNEVFQIVTKSHRENTNDYKVFKDIYITDTKKSIIGESNSEDKTPKCTDSKFLNKEVKECISFKPTNDTLDRKGIDILNNINIKGEGDYNDIEKLFIDNFELLSFSFIGEDISTGFDMYEYLKDNADSDFSLTKEFLNKHNQIIENNNNYTMIEYFIDKRDNLDLKKFKSINEFIYSSKDYNRIILFIKKVNEKGEKSFEINFIPNLRYNLIIKDFFDLSLNEKVLEDLFQITSEINLKEKLLKEKNNQEKEKINQDKINF